MTTNISGYRSGKGACNDKASASAGDIVSEQGPHKVGDDNLTFAPWESSALAGVKK